MSRDEEPKTKHHRTAGGVVIDGTGRFLVLERDVERDGAIVHEVRLPKGHIDAGESERDAALREVGEESGYWDLEILADLGTDHSKFGFRGRHHVREERYYLMRLTRPEPRGQQMHPGSEEALFVPAWLEPQEAEARLSYASERGFAARARAWLGMHGSARQNFQPE